MVHEIPENRESHEEEGPDRSVRVRLRLHIDADHVYGLEHELVPTGARSKLEEHVHGRPTVVEVHVRIPPPPPLGLAVLAGHDHRVVVVPKAAATG